MKHPADLAVYDKQGQIVLVIEVKTSIGTDGEWAAMLRRNWLVHGMLSPAPYFLLALPDRFYLWVNAPVHALNIMPTYEFDPTPILLPYLEKSKIEPKDLGETELALILSAWLYELMKVDDISETTSAAFDFLVSSGLVENIRHGKFAFDAVV